MREFKAGEEIIFYNNGDRGRAFVIGTHNTTGAIYIRNGNLDMLVHPKQCRHLKAKEKSVRITKRQFERMWYEVNNVKQIKPFNSVEENLLWLMGLKP